jgi:uncharacterized RDD family membrane protein YckC
VAAEQGTLEFLPAAQPKPRTLGTTVEASIYCESPVATPRHRMIAAMFDGSLIALAYGIILLVFHKMGGEFPTDRRGLLVFAAMLLVVCLLYGLVWAVAGRDTAGMRFVHLRLTTFDGNAPEWKQRVRRCLATCFSICCLGMGVAWSLLEEESLCWQDHMSHTFPTPRELDSQVLHRR